MSRRTISDLDPDDYLYVDFGEAPKRNLWRSYSRLEEPGPADDPDPADLDDDNAASAQAPDAGGGLPGEVPELPSARECLDPDPGERHDEALVSAGPDPARCACLWCDGNFQRRPSGGRLQIFCSTRCRRAFDGAARAWVRQALDDGTLSLENLRMASPATRALVPEASGPGGVVW